MIRCFECGIEVDGINFIMPIPPRFGGKKSIYFCEDDFIFVERGCRNLTGYEHSERIKKVLQDRKNKGMVLGRPKLKIKSIVKAAEFRLMGYSWPKIAQLVNAPPATIRRRVLEYLNSEYFSFGQEIKKDIQTRQQLKGEIKCQQSELPHNSERSS